MTERARDEAQPAMEDSPLQVQQRELHISDSPCSYIPSLIFTGLATSNEGNEDQGHMGLSQMAVVPGSIEGITEINALEISQSLGPHRLIYDMQFASGDEDFPGMLARSEGDPPLNLQGDPNVDLCYDNLGIAWNFFHELFGRQSIDDKGAPLIGIVNFGFFYPNATYSTTKATLQHVLVFGNGFDNDPWNHGAPTNTWAGMFGGFVGSLEVVVHEMMHGITQLHVDLLATEEPGALNEHLSDVFGVMAEQWHKKQTVEQADWLVGEDCLIPEKKGFAMRSFINPGTAYSFEKEGSDSSEMAKDSDGGELDEINFEFRGFIKDPQKAEFADRFLGSDDNGGVHINSGIPNKAFYLLAKKLGGYSWEKAGQIWYSVLTSNQVPKNCTFRGWAARTIQVATKDPRFGAPIAAKVLEAWKEVGVNPRY